MVWAVTRIGSHARVVVTFGLSYVLATASCRLVERPLQRRFGRRRVGTDVGPVAA